MLPEGLGAGWIETHGGRDCVAVTWPMTSESIERFPAKGFFRTAGEAETRNPQIARLDREGTASSGGNASRLRRAGAPIRALRAVRGLAMATSRLRRVVPGVAHSTAICPDRGCWHGAPSRVWPRTRRWPPRRWRPAAFARARCPGLPGIAHRGSRPPVSDDTRIACSRRGRQNEYAFCDNWRPVDPDTPGTTWPAPRSSCGPLVCDNPFGHRSANHGGGCRAQGQRMEGCRATGRACDRGSWWSPVATRSASVPERRHARAGRSPRVSEAGAPAQDRPLVDRASACDTLGGNDGRDAGDGVVNRDPGKDHRA